MDIFNLIDKTMTSDDKNLISDISNYSMDNLINDISHLSDDVLGLIFSSEKLIKDVELNKKGLHIFRCLFAERVFDERRKVLGYNNNQYYDTFKNEGAIVIENYFQENEWNQIKDISNKNLNIGNPTNINLTQDNFFQDLIKLATALPNGYQSLGTEFLVHIDGDRQFVPEYLHSDIFQPSIKIWLYLEDVSLDKGPLSYVMGSHRKNPKVLEWWYKMSCIACDETHKEFETYIYRDSSDKNNWDFSPCLKSGASEEEINIELEKLDLPEITRFSKKENTLIIVDTSGFHGRGKAKAGMTRFSLRGGIRENPFVFFE